MSTTPLWAFVTDLPADLQSSASALDALEFASHVMWSLTGRKYGPEAIVTEAYDSRVALGSSSQVYPVFLNGRPYNIDGCSTCRCTGCGVFHRTRLRGAPVNYIVDVWANGCLLPRTAYALLDHSVLGLMDARACGLQCLTVRYSTNGLPPGGKMAALQLARQLLLSEAGSGDCQLPARVTNISRQGMSFTLLDPQDFLDKGRTGIYEIDLLLAATNPAKALAPARVFSPDLPRATAFSYAEPPLSVLLGDDDQPVLAGSSMRFATSSIRVAAAVRAGDQLLTRVGDVIAAANWLVADGGAVLDLTNIETSGVRDGDAYTVENAAGDLLLTGRVRVL